jgi:hypothetical protein
MIVHCLSSISKKVEIVLTHEDGHNYFETKEPRYIPLMRRLLENDFDETIGFPPSFALFKRGSLEAMLGTLYILQFSHGMILKGADYDPEDEETKLHPKNV